MANKRNIISGRFASDQNSEKTAQAGKHPGGQPTKYVESVHVPWGVSLARRGCTDDEIAEAFGVSTRTVYRWKKAHPEFCHALNETKSQADEKVVDGLYRRACGASVVTKTESITERDGVKTKKIEKVTKELPPDVSACIYWLKNRQPALWNDNPAEFAQDAGDAAIKRAIREAGLA